jgi:hypothetical protein
VSSLRLGALPRIVGSRHLFVNEKTAQWGQKPASCGPAYAIRMSPNVMAMEHPEGANDFDEHLGSHVTDDAIRRLAEAVARLGNDPDWFVHALTETVLAMKPVSPSKFTKQQEQYLIESGSFTAEELAGTRREIARGSLQLGAVQAWLSDMCATISLGDAVGFLGWLEDDVRTAVSEGRLYAIEISGRLRFPAWQFVGSSEKLIPGLAEVIKVVAPRWSWHSVAGFMRTPQSSLVAGGRMTPVEWLRDGGDVRAVRKIVESDDRW